MHQLNRKEVSCQLKKLDKYYTKKSVVLTCLENVSLLEYDCVIEPSAGAGAFYHEIHHDNKVGLDIVPEGKGIQKGNWLEYAVSKKYNDVLVIGNPPFGQYHKLSKQFIQHALQFSNVKTIAFILPSVYKKHTRQNIIPKTWRIKNIIDLPRYSFTIGEKDFHIASSFFIIDKSKGKDMRTPNISHITDTNDFAFGTRNDYDIFVFGASPRRIVSNPNSRNRGYFLKSKIETKKLIKKVREVDWKGNSCANGGVYWLNKTEFIEQYIAYHYG